jgi:hypothetical protein
LAELSGALDSSMQHFPGGARKLRRGKVGAAKGHIMQGTQVVIHGLLTTRGHCQSEADKTTGSAFGNGREKAMQDVGARLVEMFERC